MRATSFGALSALGLVATLAGCETTERRLPSNTNAPTTVDDAPRETQLDRLQAAVEDEPESARAWYLLGEHQEAARQWPEAIDAYTHLWDLCQQDPQGRKFTAGWYHLGRAYAKARMYSEAVRCLREVVAMQPADATEASLNHHFRETHYLLGAIYFETRQWQAAKEQFVTFEQLGGEQERVEPWLSEVEEAMWTGQVRTERTDRPVEAHPTPPPAAAIDAPGAPAPAGQ